MFGLNCILFVQHLNHRITWQHTRNIFFTWMIHSFDSFSLFLKFWDAHIFGDYCQELVPLVVKHLIEFYRLSLDQLHLFQGNVFLVDSLILFLHCFYELLFCQQIIVLQVPIYFVINNSFTAICVYLLAKFLVFCSGFVKLLIYLLKAAL